MQKKTLCLLQQHQ